MHRLALLRRQLSKISQNATPELNRASSQRVVVPGDLVSGFRVLTADRVPELELTALRLVHEKTHADYLHIARDDPNNVFAVGFCTPPTDSSGVPHILEHTVLCGSTQYPVRDPFFKMLNRSLSNYMNAFTASDYTAYPFATTNLQDFRNLLSVYFDAVFQPNLREIDFRQEGWRLEHQDPRDPTSPIMFKGIVFNEMKGALSDTDSLFSTRLQAALFPGSIYAHNSGGEPLSILGLSHEQLVAFHRKCYRPSNARFFTYGSQPIYAYAEQIDAGLRALPHAEAKKAASPVSIERVARLSKPAYVTETCPVDPAEDPERPCKVAIAFAMNDTTDTFESFALSILSSLLLSGPASPMFKALIESGLGSAYAPSTGYDSHSRDAAFSIGLRGMRVDQVDKLEPLVLQTLEDVARDGFPSERIEAVLHQIEVGIKHQTPSFGLNLVQALLPAMVYGGNPADFLRLNEKIARLRTELAKGGFFESKIREHFLDNQHRVTVVMTPDPQYQAQQKFLEDAQLESQRKKADLSQVYSEGVKLADNQEASVDVSVLPTLSLSDLSPVELDQDEKRLRHDTVAGHPVQWNLQPTNGLSYVRMVVDLRGLPTSLRPFVPLYCGALTFLGTSTRDFRRLAQDTELLTADLSVGPFVGVSPRDLHSFEDAVAITVSALNRNVGPAFELLEDVLTRAEFTDTARLALLINKSASTAASSIAESGHQYARSYAAAALDAASSRAYSAAMLSEIYGGLSQVRLLAELRQLSEDPDKLRSVLSSFRHIHQLVLSAKSRRVAVVSDSDGLKECEARLPGLLTALKPDALQRVADNSSSDIDRGQPLEVDSSKAFFQAGLPVYHVSQCLPTVPYVHPDSAALALLSQLLTKTYLHREIREKNGAYGGGLRFSPLDGLLSFYSYRDPDMRNSLAAFSNSVRQFLGDLTNSELTAQDLTEAKLAVFSKIDAPVAPSSKGSSLFLHGISLDMRQERRTRLLQICYEDLRRVAEKYLLAPSQSHSQSSFATAVIGGEPVGELDKDWSIKTVA